ncbi:P-loop containing nucleoside triphosphate hydrolase protein [Lactarius indigo]|nr:P-loop containing nucleoside triphosphate hydrolase protein [Lactarius indigo]
MDGSLFIPLFESLRSAPTAPDAKAASDKLAQEISKQGFSSFHHGKAFQSFAAVLGPPAAPVLLPSLPTLFDLYMDKGEVVRQAAAGATKAILKLFPPESTHLRTAKWRTKAAALDAMRTFVSGAEEAVATELAAILPPVTAAMHDTKNEVTSAAVKCATALCTTLANADLAPHIPILVKCMSDPTSVPLCIKSLSNTTFVAEVTAPALAVLVPLLTRALNDRSMEVQRRTVVVIDNLVKLVRDPSPLVIGVNKIAEGAAFPEVRAFAEGALNTLQKAGASSGADALPPRDVTAEAGGLLSAQDPYLAIVLDFTATVWRGCVGVYVAPWLPNVKDGGTAFAELVWKHFHAIERAKHAHANDADSEDEEVLCDTVFSLAYGALLLLSHTSLKLYRGRRYGILGANGSGKSTLMRQLRDGKVENFPPQDQLRCVMVEHSLQGEDTSLSVIDFIVSDKGLAHIPRDKIQEQLREVGFDSSRQTEVVGGLSGGWKMKLELARAMLYNADLLLLDELDRASVAWLEQYLIAHTNVTCLIVNNVTTDVIHYEDKKLVYYHGNLSKFVETHPEAKSYYTLAATSVKFSFPPPGSLMGVRSNTRAILKMNNCTFTYPGKSNPSLINVSCAYHYRGIIGPNGAGKSTLIKLLTGETEPQIGTVYKHPSLRIGYVSQHATHHIERHLEKTPIQYIQWRFQDGHDREILEKATRVLTDEEKAVLNKDFVGKNGQRRKLELIMGRQKLKKSLQYEIKWQGLDHKFNTWIPRDELLEKEASREGAGQRDTSAHNIGLDGDIAQYNEIAGLSGGQKIKLVIGACLWNNPQICVLDEPSNFLDREALGGLAVAIRDWSGAVVIISHNEEFVNALCPEIWNISEGRMTHKGKAAVVEDAFADIKSPRGSGANTPVRSRIHSPAVSAAATPAASGAEDKGTSSCSPTRNQMKAQEERRRLRKLHWLQFGGVKPEDTDDD